MATLHSVLDALTWLDGWESGCQCERNVVEVVISTKRSDEQLLSGECLRAKLDFVLWVALDALEEDARHVSSPRLLTKGHSSFKFQEGHGRIQGVGLQVRLGSFHSLEETVWKPQEQFGLGWTSSIRERTQKQCSYTHVNNIYNGTCSKPAPMFDDDVLYATNALCIHITARTNTKHEHMTSWRQTRITRYTTSQCRYKLKQTKVWNVRVWHILKCIMSLRPCAEHVHDHQHIWWSRACNDMVQVRFYIHGAACSNFGSVVCCVHWAQPCAIKGTNCICLLVKR